MVPSEIAMMMVLVMILLEGKWATSVVRVIRLKNTDWNVANSDALVSGFESYGVVGRIQQFGSCSLTTWGWSCFEGHFTLPCSCMGRNL